MTYLPNPGYITIWQETDKNFDGIIDAYRQRDRKGVSRVGKPMDPAPFQPLDPGVAGPRPASSQDGGKAERRKTDEEELVNRMNERWNYR